MLFAELTRDLADVLRARNLQLCLYLVSKLHLHDEDLVLVETTTLQAALAPRGRLAATAFIHCIQRRFSIKIRAKAFVLMCCRGLLGCRILGCCRLLDKRNVMRRGNYLVLRRILDIALRYAGLLLIAHATLHFWNFLKS
jgi:hypothetical protein